MFSRTRATDVHARINWKARRQLLRCLSLEELLAPDLVRRTESSLVLLKGWNLETVGLAILVAGGGISTVGIFHLLVVWISWFRRKHWFQRFVLFNCVHGVLTFQVVRKRNAGAPRVFSLFHWSTVSQVLAGCSYHAYVNPCMRTRAHLWPCSNQSTTKKCLLP